MRKKEQITCPACGAKMKLSEHRESGFIYTCPNCSCRKISMGVATS